MEYKLISEVKNETVLETVFRNRNVDISNIEEFCYPSFLNVQNPFEYYNMEMAIDRYMKAISENENIGILVDSDTDGYCSGSALVQLTVNYFKHNKVTVFMHTEKTHGLTNEIMSKIQETNIDLMIIADAASENFMQHKILKDKGIDILILDHHLADRYSGSAIVVNNQLQDSSNKSLCGMGMVQKFLEAIQLKYGHTVANLFIDLTAIALIGDCMEMKSLENRYYVTQGLRNINNPLLQQLFIGDKFKDYKTVSFDIVPTLNAFIRVGSMEEKCDLFYALCGLSLDRNITIRGLGEMQVSLQEYIKRMSSRIKSRQTKMVDEILMHSDLQLYAKGLPFAVAIMPQIANKNLSGLIASKLADKLGKPTLVLKGLGTQLRGSARTIDGYKEFRSYIKNLGYFSFAEGHQEAFGVGIQYANFEKMRKELVDDREIKGTIMVDKIYDNNLYPFDVLSIAELKHQWGRGFESPKFIVKIDKSNINDFKIVGNKKDTIRFKFNEITFIKFKCSQEEVSDICEKIESGDCVLELLCEFDSNIWNDNTYPQANIDDINLIAL